MSDKLLVLPVLTTIVSASALIWGAKRGLVPLSGWDVHREQHPLWFWFIMLMFGACFLGGVTMIASNAMGAVVQP